jgi:hypothetical protein
LSSAFSVLLTFFPFGMVELFTFFCYNKKKTITEKIKRKKALEKMNIQDLE